jgi:hypothetical protein
MGAQLMASIQDGRTRFNIWGPPSNLGPIILELGRGVKIWKGTIEGTQTNQIKTEGLGGWLPGLKKGEDNPNPGTQGSPSEIEWFGWMVPGLRAQTHVE